MASSDLSIPSELVIPLSEAFLCSLDDAWVLYIPQADRLLILNPTAKIICDLLGAGYTTAEIAAALVECFGISDKLAGEDVAQLIAQLAEICAHDKTASASAAASDSRPSEDATARARPLADCGAFRFGGSHVRILSAVEGLDADCFARFQHRAVNDRDGADVVLIDGSEPAYRLGFRGQVIAESRTINQTMRQLTEFLLSLEHPGKDILAICHAGAVSRGGRSLLMPGGSGIGKSTLTAFLTAHGFAYLGDDLIAIGEDALELLPQPTSLSVKAGSWTVLEPFYPALPKLPTLNRCGRIMRYVDPGSTYASLQAAAAPTAIVFPAYRAGEITRLERVPPIRTMIRLLEAHACLSEREAATTERLTKFVRFVEQTPAYELSYSQLPEALTVIEDLLGSQS